MGAKSNNRKIAVIFFLQYAVWGAYLTSLGSLVGNAGLGNYIWAFYMVPCIAAVLFPPLFGAIADKWIEPKKLLSISHFASSALLLAAGIFIMRHLHRVPAWPLFLMYAAGMSFYMPTLALSDSVAMDILESEGKDTVSDLPKLRVFGTVGFIVAMVVVDLLHWGHLPYQLMLSAVLGFVLALYARTLPSVKKIVSEKAEKVNLFKDLKNVFSHGNLAAFLIFSVFLGAALQITNGYANPYFMSFRSDATAASSIIARYPGCVLVLSQISEALCILLIPFFMKRFGIRKVIIISMVAWIIRFALLGLGSPTGWGASLFVVSCLVYGVAFDFFNISGSLYIRTMTPKGHEATYQGVFKLATNGLGALAGTAGAGIVTNSMLHSTRVNDQILLVGNTPDSWAKVWYIFALYMLVVLVANIICYRENVGTIHGSDTTGYEKNRKGFDEN